MMMMMMMMLFFLLTMLLFFGWLPPPLTHLPVWLRSERAEMKFGYEMLLNFMPQWTLLSRIWLPFSGRVKLTRVVAGSFDGMIIQNTADNPKQKKGSQMNIRNSHHCPLCTVTILGRLMLKCYERHCRVLGYMFSKTPLSLLKVSWRNRTKGVILLQRRPLCSLWANSFQTFVINSE